MRFGFPVARHIRKHWYDRAVPFATGCAYNGGLARSLGAAFYGPPERSDNRIHFFQMWIKPMQHYERFNGASPSSRQGIISGYRGASDYWYLYIDESGRLHYTGVNGGVTHFDFAIPAYYILSNGQWYNLKILIDTNQFSLSSGFKIYINDALVGSYSPNTYTQNQPAFIFGDGTNTWTIRLGLDYQGLYPFSGLFSQYCIAHGYLPNVEYVAGERYHFRYGNDYYNLLPNPSFDSGTTGWTAYNSATLASVAGGKISNCLQITENGAADPGAYDDFGNGNLVIGNMYHMEVWVKQGTESTYKVWVCETDFSNPQYQDQSYEATSSWVKHEFTFRATATTMRIVLQQICAVSAATTMLFDELIVAWRDYKKYALTRYESPFGALYPPGDGRIYPKSGFTDSEGYVEISMPDPISGWNYGNILGGTPSVVNLGDRRKYVCYSNGSKAYMSKMLANANGYRYCAVLKVTNIGSDSAWVRLSKNSDLSSPFESHQVNFSNTRDQDIDVLMHWDGDGVGNVYIGVECNLTYTWAGFEIWNGGFYHDMGDNYQYTNFFERLMNWGRLAMFQDYVYQPFDNPSYQYFRTQEGHLIGFSHSYASSGLIWCHHGITRNFPIVNPLIPSGHSSLGNVDLDEAGTRITAGFGGSSYKPWRSDMPLPRQGKWEWRIATYSASYTMGIIDDPHCIDNCDGSEVQHKIPGTVTAYDWYYFWLDADTGKLEYAHESATGSPITLASSLDMTKDWFIMGLYTGEFDPGWVDKEFDAIRTGYKKLVIEQMPFPNAVASDPEKSVKIYTRDHDSNDKTIPIKWNSDGEDTLVIGRSYGGTVLGDSLKTILCDTYMGAGKDFCIGTNFRTSTGGVKSFNDKSIVIDGTTDHPWNWNDRQCEMALRFNPAFGSAMLSIVGNATDRGIAHGLGAAPEFLMIVPHSALYDAIMWHVATYSAGFGATNMSYWRASLIYYPDPDTGSPDVFQNKIPDSTYIYLGGGSNVYNLNSIPYSIYLFRSMPGLCKCFWYEGTGSLVDAPYIHTGFMPGLTFIKCVDGDYGMVFQHHDYYEGRIGSGYVGSFLRFDQQAVNAAGECWFNANGIKIQNTVNAMNALGKRYVGITWAFRPNIPIAKGVWESIQL